jgi:hypothetical protein
MIRSLRAAIIAAVLSMFAVVSHAGSCQPTWIYLSKGQPLSVDSGTYTVKFSAILIGCEQNLGALKEVEIGKVQLALKRFLGERSLDLVGSAETRKLRQDAAAAMNRALGRQAVADVFFSYLAIGEAM